jgi:transcription initiation factor IIE alpha subunit
MVDNRCPICFEDFGDNNIVIFECGHKFHHSCTIEMFNRDQWRCPVCRADLQFYENTRIINSPVEDSDDDSDDERDTEFTFSFSHNLKGIESYLLLAIILVILTK